MTDEPREDRARGDASEAGRVRPVDPEDEFWDVEPYSGESTSANDLDDVLY